MYDRFEFIFLPSVASNVVKFNEMMWTTRSPFQRRLRVPLESLKHWEARDDFEAMNILMAQMPFVHPVVSKAERDVRNSKLWTEIRVICPGLLKAKWIFVKKRIGADGFYVEPGVVDWRIAARKAGCVKHEFDCQCLRPSLWELEKRGLTQEVRGTHPFMRANEDLDPEERVSFPWWKTYEHDTGEWPYTPLQHLKWQHEPFPKTRKIRYLDVYGEHFRKKAEAALVMHLRKGRHRQTCGRDELVAPVV